MDNKYTFCKYLRLLLSPPNANGAFKIGKTSVSMKFQIHLLICYLLCVL